MYNRELNINKGEEYVIKVNEQGDTLTLYIGDGDMPKRFSDAFDELHKLDKKTKGRINRIRAMDKGERHNDLLSKADYETAKVMSDQFIDGRRIVNKLFNDDTASDKLFGNANTITMFYDFFEQFEPIMKDIAEKQEGYIEGFKDKYSQEESNILE